MTDATSGFPSPTELVVQLFRESGGSAAPIARADVEAAVYAAAGEDAEKAMAFYDAVTDLRSRVVRPSGPDGAYAVAGTATFLRLHRQTVRSIMTTGSVEAELSPPTVAMMTGGHSGPEFDERMAASRADPAFATHFRATALDHAVEHALSTLSFLLGVELAADGFEFCVSGRFDREGTRGRPFLTLLGFATEGVIDHG